jgi:hypothetical protein
MRFLPHRGTALAAVLAAVLLSAPPSRAGVSNPDISVIGRPFMRWTDDAADPGRKRWRLDPGEVEFMFDAALNPYARGTFIASMAEGQAGIEEAYFSMTRGLPLGLALKGGKYRAGFGKLNPQHPHAYPFADRFRVLAEYLPGEESFNETGVQLSEQLALPHDIALTVSGDWLQGDSFRRARVPSGAANDPLASGGDDGLAEPRAAGLGRVAAFVPAGERSGVELGVSATQGTNNAAAGTRTSVLGADAKAKLWRSASSYLLLQGEYLALDREDAAWDSTSAAYTSTRTRPSGGYLYADWNFSPRTNAGVGYERWQGAGPGGLWNTGLRAFAGLSLMEETTSFRIDVERVLPGTPGGAPTPDPIHTVTIRVVYSMGPHKAHQF